MTKKIRINSETTFNPQTGEIETNTIKRTSSSSNSPPPKTTTTPNTKTNSDNSGCIIILVFAAIGSAVIGSATDGEAWFVGTILGGIIGSKIAEFFEQL